MKRCSYLSLVCLALSSFLFTESQAQWVQTNGPAGGMVSYFAASGSNLFAGTLGHGVFLSTNNGTNWTAVNNGLTNDSVYVLVASGSNLFAATLGGVFLSTNNGTSWTAVNNGLTNRTVDGLGFSGTNLFAGTAAGVFRSTNNGSSWTAVNNGLTNTMIVSLTTTSSSVVVGTTNGVFLSTNNGDNWTAANVGLTNKIVNALAVSPASGGSGTNIFAGTYGDVAGGVFLSTNNGSTWTRASNGLTNTNLNALVFSGTNLFAGTDGGVYLSTNSGTNWNPVSTGLSGSTVWGLAVVGTDLFAGTQNAAWRRPLAEMIGSTTPPSYWTSQVSPLGSQSLGCIQFVSPTEGWVAAGNGQLIHTTNAGSTWSAVSACGNDTVAVICDPSQSMSFANTSNGWLIGSLGSFNATKGAVLYHTTNSGVSWTKQLLPSWSMGLFVQFVDVNNGWAVVGTGTGPNNMTSGALLHTTNGGSSWTTLPNAFGIPYFVDPNNGWTFNTTYAGARVNIVSRTTNGGNTWTTQLTDTTSGGFLDIQFVDVNNGWLVGDSGKVLRTTNGGTNWTRITNTGNNSKHKALFFLDANVGWIGGRLYSNQGTGIILHTIDGGGSWTSQNAPALTDMQQDIFCIYFADASHGWFTSDYGGFARTIGGATGIDDRLLSTAPAQFKLDQNYPNPFNPSTTIRYQLLEEGMVSLKVYNTLGKEVATLVTGFQKAGFYQLHWTPQLPSGVYFYRLQEGESAQTKKVMLLK